MKALYLNDQGNAVGPYPIDQVRDLLKAGSLTLDHLASIRPDGPWQPLRDFPLNPVKAATPSSAISTTTPTPTDDSEFQTFITRFLDGLTTLCISPFWRGEDTARMYSAYQDMICRAGHYSLLACGAIMFFISCVMAAKANTGYPLIAGLGFAAFMVIGHYLAVKFTTANRDLLHCDTARLNSDAVPFSVAVFSLLAVIGLVLIGLLGFVAFFNHNLTGALGILVVCLLWAFIFFHATVLSRECKALLHIDPSRGDVSGGEAFLGVIKFAARLQLALSFIFLGAGGCTAALRLAIAGFFMAFSSTGPVVNASGFGNVATVVEGGNPLESLSGILGGLGSSGYGDLGWGTSQAILTVFVPLGAYITYLLLVFAVDVLTSVIRTAKNTERIP
jgi:hypothetical protein